MSFHRQQLKQRLGLVAQGKVFSTGIEKLFEDSDLIIPTFRNNEETAGTGRQQKVRTYTLVIYIRAVGNYCI